MAGDESRDPPWYTEFQMVAVKGPVVGESRSLPASDEREEEASALSRDQRPPSSEPSSASPDGSRTGHEPDHRDVLPIEVRSVRLRDLPALRRLDTLFRLNQPEAQLGPYSPLRAGVGSSLPGSRDRRPTFVALSGDRLVGFAEFRPVSPDQRWILLAIGDSVGVYDADPVWEALLTHGVRSAGLSGSKRLYARVSSGAAITPALRRAGWSPYASETIFSAHQVPTISRHGLRPQRPADTWAIHQLYNASVPRPVHDAEALTSHHWDLRPGTSRDRERIGGWLLEDGHQLVGYARTTSRNGTHVVELVHHPERPDVLPDLIGGALAALPGRPARRVLCPVRGYQAEVANRLEEHGFAPILEQELHLRYTTANVRAPALEAVPFHVEVRDKVPQRVPTFLRGGAGDPAPRADEADALGGS